MAIIAILLVLIFLFSIIKMNKSSSNPEINLTMETHISYKEPVKNWKALMNKTIGKTSPECPYCGATLVKFPARKTKCKKCNNNILVRTRVYDEVKILITEQEDELIDIDKLKKYGEYEKYLEEKNRFNSTKKKLQELRKSEYVPDADVYWNIYNENRLIQASKRNWQAYMNTTGEMAYLLYKENKHLQAIDFYLEEAFFQICHPDEEGNFLDYSIIKECGHCCLLRYFSDCMDELDININEIKERFLKLEIIKINFPITKEKAWKYIEKEINLFSKFYG